MSSTPSTPTPEAKELELVGKVEMRIALTDSDAKLEAMLKVYLAPLLLKLGSEHLKVRNKVISICQHINTRIKAPSVKLPVAALLKQYKESHNSLVRHFDLLYIQQGIDRLPVQERLELLPTVVYGLADNFQDSASHTANLFNLFLRLMHHLVLPSRGTKEDIELRSKFGLTDNDKDAKFLSTWLGKLILYTPGQLDVKSRPGLDSNDYDFLQLFGKEDTWIPTKPGGMNIVETRILSAKFLASGVFLDSERFLPALFASADSNSRLSDVGEDMLKRAAPVISLEDRGLIEHMYSIYLGTRGSNGSLPVRTPLQIKILALLGKSKVATDFSPQIIQIVKEGLKGYESVAGSAKQGLEASKLRGQVFVFTNWIARFGSPETLHAVAPTLVADLRSYIESQGWPRKSEESSSMNTGEFASRSYGYVGIGLLAKACPEELLLEPNLDLLRWLFISLSSDTSGKDITISIEQALGSVMSAFASNADPELETALADLLLYNMRLEIDQIDGSGYKIVRSTRYAAVRFSNRCLPFNSVKARWINLLALSAGSTERNEVLEEGNRGLSPYWYRNLNPKKDNPLGDFSASPIAKYKLPLFDELIPYIFEEATVVETKKEILASAYSQAVYFCRSVLFYEALVSLDVSPVIDLDWNKNMEALITNDESIRENVKAYLATRYGNLEKPDSALWMLLHAGFTGLTVESLGDVDQSGACILELCMLSPGPVLDTLAIRISELRSIISTNKYSSRSIASHLFGILASREACPRTVLSQMTTDFLTKVELWDTAIGSTVHEVHGSVLSLSYWLSRRICVGGVVSKTSDDATRFIELVFAIVTKSHDKELRDAAILAVGQLSLFGLLSPTAMPSSYPTKSLLDKLVDEAKTGNERPISTMGYYAMQYEENNSTLNDILQHLYSMHEIRQAETQFAVGAAISCAAIGWQSKSLIGRLDVDGPFPTMPARTEVLRNVMEKVLEDCKTTKPALRQAAVIWLLCLLQYCGHLNEVQDKLKACQAVFKRFLSDKDALNQETASRGLTVIYERGNRELKDDLVRDLVASFTGTNAGLAGNVAEDTQLFEPGALRTTGDSSITTYKDIVSLASEVGDSSLVYRFMSLASSNAIWSSRAAFGRFGLSNILSDSSVDGYLSHNPKLYPALYRYRFDPNTNVRASMNEIWSALVKDSAIVIEEHFDAIIEDLLKNIVGKEWRTRQASCAAVADLIQGKPLARYEKYLNKIWTLTFKVCDDIKESVRTAAMVLAQGLTGILTRSLEAGDSSSTTANSMLKQVLPFLLSPSGLESAAKEVQIFALTTLLQIIKASTAKALRPFLADLVGRLLGLLSSLEPQQVNYLHMNAEKYGITAQQLDDARLSSVRASPMMEAIERCLDMLDDESMNALQGSLEHATKTVIGLPSRVGVSRVIVSLCTRHNFIFKPYADPFLRLMRRQVLDRNDTISSSFAVASGYLARLASDREILKLVEYCKKLYFESEDDRHRLISAELISAVAKNATDRFTALAGGLLPFTFLAKHDIEEGVKEIFEQTWSENVGGSRAVLLYLKEIVVLATPHLDSLRWSIKHTSAFTIADAVESCGSDIADANAAILWPSLEKAIGGKTWEGKERVLEAFVSFAKHSSWVKSNEKVAEKIQSIMIRECKRSNVSYRQHAFTLLGDFIAVFPSVDWFDQVLAISEPVIETSLDDTNDMDVESPSGGPSSKLIGSKTLANAIANLFKSLDPKHRDGARFSQAFGRALAPTQKAWARHDRIVLDTVIDSLKLLFQRLADAAKDPSPDLDGHLLACVALLFGPDPLVEQTRAKAADSMLVLVAVATRLGSHAKLRDAIVAVLDAALQAERVPGVRAVLQQARAAAK